MRAESLACHDVRLEEVISEFVPLIKSMAYRFATQLPPHLDVEDLVSVGVIGLMGAMTRYDPGRSVKFKTYVHSRIRGAMLDEIRAMDWIPRSVREQISVLQRTQKNLQTRYGRPATDHELAAALNMSANELAEFRSSAQGAVLVRFEDRGLQDLPGQKLMNMLVDTRSPDPFSQVLTTNQRRVLENAIEQLPEKQRLVLILYYVEELTMNEIKDVLQVTESRICQIHSRAIKRLRIRVQRLLRDLYGN